MEGEMNGREEWRGGKRSRKGEEGKGKEGVCPLP